EVQVTRAAPLLLDLVDAERRPGEHRRITAPNSPLRSGERCVQGPATNSTNMNNILLSGSGGDQGDSDEIRSTSPGSVPAALPLVRHAQDVVVVEVSPLGVAAGPA